MEKSKVYYVVHMVAGHNGVPSQIVTEGGKDYLKDEATGTAARYTMGEARRKAGIFNAKTEKRESSVFVAELRMGQVDKAQIHYGVKHLLNGREAFVDKDGSIAEKIYAADLFRNVAMLKSTQLSLNEEELGQLADLDYAARNFDYIMFIGQ